MKAQIDYLLADDHEEIARTMTQFTLTPAQAKIFILLRQNFRRVTTTVSLVRRFYDFAEDGERTVPVMIYHIRKRIAPKGWVLETVRGLGYSLLAPESEADREAGGPTGAVPRQLSSRPSHDVSA